MEIKDGIQDFLAEAGQSGCYALCLLNVAQEYNQTYQKDKKVDYLEELYKACESTSSKSPIYYNHKDINDPDNFYVQNPEAVLFNLTEKKWSVTKEFNVGYACGAREYAIQRWERDKTGQKISHFQRDTFRPLKNSLTVQYGTIRDLRVCRVW